MRLGIILNQTRLSNSDVAIIKKSIDHIRGDSQCILVLHWLSPLRWYLKELGYEYVLLISLRSFGLPKNKEVIAGAKYVVAYDADIPNFREMTKQHIMSYSDVLLVNVPDIANDALRIYNISAYIK